VCVSVNNAYTTYACTTLSKAQELHCWRALEWDSHTHIQAYTHIHIHNLHMHDTFLSTGHRVWMLAEVKVGACGIHRGVVQKGWLDYRVAMLLMEVLSANTVLAAGVCACVFVYVCVYMCAYVC
jgi:hypothetical protein